MKWSNEDEPVGLLDRCGPSLHDFVPVRRATRRRRLIEERHREVAKIEKPGVDAAALLQMLQNPVRGLFREAALTRASNDNGNDGHAFFSLVAERSARSERMHLVAGWSDVGDTVRQLRLRHRERIEGFAQQFDLASL